MVEPEDGGHEKCCLLPAEWYLEHNWDKVSLWELTHSCKWVSSVFILFLFASSCLYLQWRETGKWGERERIGKICRKGLQIRSWTCDCCWRTVASVPGPSALITKLWPSSVFIVVVQFSKAKTISTITGHLTLTYKITWEGHYNTLHGFVNFVIYFIWNWCHFDHDQCTMIGMHKSSGTIIKTCVFISKGFCWGTPFSLIEGFGERSGVRIFESLLSYAAVLS